MADEDLVIASTTDTEQEIKAALAPREDPEEAAAAPEVSAAAPAEAGAETGGERAEAAPADEEKKPDVPKPRKSRSEERINELTREKYLAQRRAERLQSELDALKQPPPPQQPQPQSPQQPQQLQQPPPLQPPDRKPTVTDFSVYEDFVDALTQWNARQISAQQIAALRAEDALAVVQAQHQEVLSQFEAAKTDARQRYPDFDQVMTSDVAIAMPITEPMQHIITTSPVGHDVAYYLVQHPDEAYQIAQLTPADAHRTLGRLEERVNILQRMSAAPSARMATGPRTTSAPPPVEPVGGHATQVGLTDDQLSYQDYKAKRDREEFQRRKQRR